MTVPYNPKQNGIPERVNRTILAKSRCINQEAECSKKMLAEGANTAVYLKNRFPHKAVAEVTPEEKLMRINLRLYCIYGFLITEE